ncbi:MAG TPA: succinate dehydrogenase, cytochrome b556 subunit [Micropepsaceae bacterium]|jgi:succinate dehydrogenase / fumarate reductase cytochrome b subunit|nr:succinate dehydrogenase, cytochrome b556 subunit [Micropepsaceae bacterium]
MADAPNSPGPSPRPYGRPLSPHLQIYRWPITMAASITHRVTGMALTAGTLFLAWWLIAAATGPDAYAVFARVAGNLFGEIVLFGFLWSIAFHLLNGIRHLAWDVGYGFKVPTAKLTAVIVYAGSVLLAGGAFAVGIMVRRGLGT